VGSEDMDFLNWALDGCEWTVLRSARFTPKERVLGSYWLEGWLSSETSLDVVTKKEILAPTWNRTPVVQPVASHPNDWAVPAVSNQKYGRGDCDR